MNINLIKKNFLLTKSNTFTSFIPLIWSILLTFTKPGSLGKKILKKLFWGNDKFCQDCNFSSENVIIIINANKMNFISDVIVLYNLFATLNCKLDCKKNLKCRQYCTWNTFRETTCFYAVCNEKRWVLVSNNIKILF